MGAVLGRGVTRPATGSPDRSEGASVPFWFRPRPRSTGSRQETLRAVLPGQSATRRHRCGWRSSRREFERQRREDGNRRAGGLSLECRPGANVRWAQRRQLHSSQVRCDLSGRRAAPYPGPLQGPPSPRYGAPAHATASSTEARPPALRLSAWCLPIHDVQSPRVQTEVRVSDTTARTAMPAGMYSPVACFQSQS
jgi:hypothetical protein